MPTRTYPSAGVGRGAAAAAGVKSKVAIASKEGPSRMQERQSRPKTEEVKGTAGRALSAARKDVSCSNGVDSHKQTAVLAAIKTPSLCSSATTDALLAWLGTSPGQLNLKSGPALGESGRKASIPVSQQSLRVTSGKSHTNQTHALDASSFDVKKIHFAKLVVNGVIQSLNDVINLGWKAREERQAIPKVAASRTSSAATTSSSRSVSAASSSKVKLENTSSATQRTTAASPLLETNVRSIFRCTQIAVHYLYEAQKLSCLEASKELELVSIMSSIVRKIMAIEMHEAAHEELVWLHASIVGIYTEERGTEVYDFPIPTAPISPQVRDIALEVQALALGSTLAGLIPTSLQAILSKTMQHPGGPLAWQQYLHSMHAAKDGGGKEAADKHAYSIERILSKLIAKHAKDATGMDPLLTLECRRYSLFLLLFVSDLDSEAFWDRAARVGSNYFRSNISTESASSTQLKKAFKTVDDLFRDIHRRAEQLQRNVPSTDADDKLQSKGFSRFCESWMQLAKRAGERQAMDHIVSLLENRAESDMRSSATLSAQEVDVMVVQTCALLSRWVVALDELLAGRSSSILTDCRLAEADLDSAIKVTRLARDEGVRKIVKVLDQLRRRSLRVIEEKKCAQSELVSVLLAISRHYEAYLEAGVPGQAEDDGAILDDYLCIFRSLANAVFSVSDWATHEAAAAYLSKCHAILESQMGRMKNVDDITRASKWRLVSSSWYCIGGQLYNEKKLSLAVRFLKSACESAQLSLDISRAAAKAQKADAPLIERVENVAKKWEHLAVSYRYTNQHNMSYGAYVNGLLSVDEAVWDAIIEKSRSVPICELFPERRQEPGEKKIGEVGSMAKAALEVAFFDLLAVDAWTEGRSFVPVLLEEGIPCEAVAAILEYCLLSLDHTMHRDEAPQAATFLINTLLELYPAQESPIRRARVLIRRLELAALQPQLFGRAEGVQQIDSTAEECRELLGAELHHLDSQFASYIPQYQTSLFLSLLLMEQQRPCKPLTSRVAHLTDDATTWMERLSRKVSTCAATETATATTRTVKSVGAPLKTRSPLAQVTPSTGSKTRPGRPLAKSTFATPEAAILVLDNPGRFCRLLELTIEVLQTCGYVVPEVKLLVAATKMIEAMSDNKEEEAIFLSSLMRLQMRLGLVGEAGQLVSRLKMSVEAKDISRSSKVKCLFFIAQYYCLIGRTEESRDTYKTAVSIASQIGLEERANSLQQGVNRCLMIERQALAAETHALIEAADGHSTTALRFAVLSLRSAIKASSQLSRLTATRIDNESSHSPFAQAGSDVETPEAASHSPTNVESTMLVKGGPRIGSWAVGILYWRLTNTLVESYLRTAQLYGTRGSARDADAFLGETIDFASGVHIPLTLAQAYLHRSILLAKMRLDEKGALDLQQALVYVEEGATSVEALQCAMARAEQQERAKDLPGALQQLDTADKIHSALSTQIGGLLLSPKDQVKSVKSSPRKKSSPLRSQEVALATMKRSIRKQQVRIQQRLDLTAQEECGPRPIGPTSGAEKGEDEVEDARRELYLSLQQLSVDPIMSMLPESVVSMPMIQSSKTKTVRTLAAPVKLAVSHLNSARNLLEKVVNGKTASQMDSLVLREACINLAYATSLGGALGCGREGALNAADVLEKACSLTLQREMLEALDIKLDQKVGISSACIPGWQASHNTITPSNVKQSSSDESSDEELREESPVKLSLETMRGHHTQTSKADLPTNWTVVSISLYRERNCLILTRRDGGESTPPLVFHLSIDRQSRREGEEEDEGPASVDNLLGELKSIIEESNVATHAAQHLQGMQARKDWWTRRRELDARLKELLGIVETTWLGAFKSVLMPQPRVTEEDFAALRTSFDAVFQRALFATSISGGRDASPQVSLDQRIFECFTALAFTTCTDEELEDLTHYVMDAYQFHGQPVAVDEVDLDLCVTDLRAILEGFKSKQQARAGSEEDDRHLFLILDRDTCAIPWESIPLLRNQAVCRIPSMAFLQDRLEHTRLAGTFGRHQIDSASAKVWCLLNPSQDLTRTQERFLPWIESMQRKKKTPEEPLWTSIVNRAPVVNEMAEALQKNDIAIYFGHGGGEQYIRASTLKALPKCAVTMLWGCSSSVLRYLGDFDRTGTPHNYLMANCPSLLGNLWDTTDKELDGISESVLVKMGLKEADGGGVGKKEKEKGGGGYLSIAQAVAQSRDACKLPYLTGAACIVYGIPVYYQ